MHEGKSGSLKTVRPLHCARVSGSRSCRKSGSVSCAFFQSAMVDGRFG